MNHQTRTTTDRRADATDAAVTAFQIERRVAARRAADQQVDRFNEQLARWHAHRAAA